MKTSTPNATVQIFDSGNSTPIGTAQVVGDSFTCTLTGLVPHTYNLTAHSGVAISPVRSFTVTQPQTAPVITRVLGETGSVNSGGETTDTTLVFSGTASPNATGELLDGATRLGIITADSTGQWSVQVSGLSLKQYSVTAKTLGGVSPAWLFTVKPLTPPLTIDTSPLSLSGHLVRYGRTPTHPPAGTTTTRSASGGTPPYRYAKSTDAVNLDTATGTVISFRNGQATITVTDANGQQASYNVSVSNVLELDGYSGNSIYRDSTTHAANYGGRIPTLQEWQELRATYGGSPALPPAEADENAWSTTSAGGINYTTISPNKGTTGIQPDVLVVIGGRGLAKGWAIVTRYAK